MFYIGLIYLCIIVSIHQAEIHGVRKELLHLNGPFTPDIKICICVDKRVNG